MGVRVAVTTHTVEILEGVTKLQSWQIWMPEREREREIFHTIAGVG